MAMAVDIRAFPRAGMVVGCALPLHFSAHAFTNFGLGFPGGSLKQGRGYQYKSYPAAPTLPLVGRAPFSLSFFTCSGWLALGSAPMLVVAGV